MSLRARLTPSFQGWRIVRSGLFIQALHSGLIFSGYSLFAAELKEEYGWSNAVFGGAFALNRLESGLLGPLQGWMTDAWGPKAVLRLGAVIMSLGLLLFSFTETVIQFYAFFLLIALGSSFAGFLSITVAIVTWFDRKRSRALAYGQMGFAVGGLVAFVVGLAIQQVGWRNTARISALLVLVVILATSRHFDRRPSDIGQFVDGIDPAAPEDPTLRKSTSTLVHFTANEALRTRAFWFISLGHAAALLVVGAAMAHLALYLEDERGLSKFHVAVVTGALPIMMGVGQYLGGVLGDGLPKRPLLAASMLGHAGGLALLAWATGPTMIWLFVLVHGLAWGVRGPLQSSLRADYFGATDFGKIMGFSSLIVMVGMMFGPIFAGVVADRTGSFQIGFTILAAGAALGSLFFWHAAPPTPPARAKSANPSNTHMTIGNDAAAPVAD